MTMETIKTWLLVAVGLAVAYLYAAKVDAEKEALEAQASLSEYRSQVNEQAARRLEEYNRDALIRQSNFERSAQAQHARDEALRKAVVAGNRAAASLRDQIAELERRPVPKDSGTAAYAHEASTARGLLGQCSDRYRALDERAKELGSQVVGLQEYAAGVCQPSLQ